MYLAHELAVLNIQVVNMLPDHIVTTFMDFVEPLRIEGYKILDAQTVLQKQQLIEILANSGWWTFLQSYYWKGEWMF